MATESPWLLVLFQLFLQHLSTVLGLALGVLLIARILRQNIRPSVSIAWLLAIILIPYVGVPLYLLFGGRKLTWWSGEKKPLYQELTPLPFDEIDTVSHVENVLIAANMPPARRGGSMEFLPSGESTYLEICNLIDSAQSRIHIVTFILGRDEIGRSLIERLAKKAAEGVEVRLLLDGLGCILVRERHLHLLREAGGRIGIFMPMSPIKGRLSTHLRNHRKLILVDGEKAMIGGMNLTKDYMGAKPDPGRWIDTAAVIQGPTVADLEKIFVSDWNFATGDSIHYELIEEPKSDPVANHERILQIAASGPDVAGEPLYEALLAATFEARKRILITTPYFVPDEGIFRALMLQARLGNDVRILLPKHSNHPLADIARGRFLRALVVAGAKIYLYPERMIHAKHAVFDDNLAMAGSANLDMRSLYLNYELALFMHSENEVRTIADWMHGLMEASEMMKPDDLPVGRMRQWGEDLSLLVSPLL